jgi:hypothetical protein
VDQTDHKELLELLVLKDLLAVLVLLDQQDRKVIQHIVHVHHPISVVVIPLPSDQLKRLKKWHL